MPTRRPPVARAGALAAAPAAGAIRRAALLLLGAPLALQAAAAPPAGSPPGATPPSVNAAMPALNTPLACLIVPDKVADVGSAVIGIVGEIGVERGDSVVKGQLVARLRAEVESASASVARSRADAQAELGAAIAARDLAEQRLARAQELHAQKFISVVALDQTQSEYNVARGRAQQVQEQLATSGREAAVAGAQLSQRRIVAPFDGIVVERYLNPGERVEDKPIVRIAAISPLRVEMVVPTAMFGRLREGDVATVQPELAGLAAREARITRIDKVLDPASNTFRVRLEIANADGSLPAGLRCKASFGGDAHGTGALAPAAAAGRPTAPIGAAAARPAVSAGDAARTGPGAAPTGNPAPARVALRMDPGR